jgi:hypothetical protein
MVKLSQVCYSPPLMSVADRLAGAQKRAYIARNLANTVLEDLALRQ